MPNKLEKVKGEMDRIADCFDRPEIKMNGDEFGERIMQTSVLATSYATTAQADDQGRVIYRRMNNLRVGVTAAAVYALKGEAQISRNEFVDYAVKIYMAYAGIPFTDPNYIARKLYCKAVIYSYLERLLSLGLLTTSVKNGVHYLKLEPELGSCAYAMLMDPESTLRSPYLKAMAQTTGAMAVVDKNQEKLTKGEVASLVLDSLSGRVLDSTKSPSKFIQQNIFPFHHLRNHVPFYSERQEDKLIILPTFPVPGTTLRPSEVPSPIMSPEFALEVFGQAELEKFTSGPNPSLVRVASPGSGEGFYFYHDDPVIRAWAKHFKVEPTRFKPEASVAAAVLSEIQSKLGPEHYDPVRVSSAIQKFIEGDRIKTNELTDIVTRKTYVVLALRTPLVEADSEGFIRVKEESKGLLISLLGLCNIRSATSKAVAKVAAGL